MSLPRAPLALITGASSGIGAAIARSLASPGALLLLTGRNRTRLAGVAADARAAGAEAISIAGPLEDDAHLAEIIARLEAARPGAGLDLLVHAAAGFEFASIEELAIAEFDSMLRVNLRAPLVLTRALVPRLESAGGQVVFVNSSAVDRARARTAAYTVSKHGLRGLAAVLREELNPRGIRVLSVYPGRTATPMQEAVARAEATVYAPDRLLQPSDVACAVLGLLRLPRSAEATDLHLRPAAPPGATG